jgi:phage terminase large subunit-like protein
MTAPAAIDAITRAWIRNPSDEKAAANGCTFDVERAAYAVWWIERCCRLYEGEQAGEPLLLHGCHECGTYDLPPANELPDWDEESQAICLERARRYAECVAADHRRDWQYECLMRLFGWVRFSEKWKRPVRRFKQGSVWVPKKNKKSPTLAAIGLYLTCGDGEPGQKTFFGAKDGNQAKEIAGQHAVKMLAQCDELADECDVNKGTSQITHRPTNSILKPMSSGNERTQQSKEGLNGSVLIDETHVVDRDFMSRISRAGISRSEPLQLEVSTAGNNPDGYGKERFDYALEVEAGKRDDEELFVAIYAAPQDLTDADLDADPLKWGRLANPAMGHTVDPEEFLRDYERSKRSLRTLLDFRMYRLNNWQRSASPWIRSSDWALCKRPFEEAELEGRECCAGLDLSKTQDMSSLVLVFPWENDPGVAEGLKTFRLLPFFWLPEVVAKEKGHLAPFEKWARDGLLQLTPGSVIDYGFIRAQFRRLAKRFVIRKLAYDVTYAEETTQALEQGVVDDMGKQLEEGTGVERVPFPQTVMEFAAPCKDFERFVLAGTLHHNGHPILEWQAGHVQVRRDPNDNIRPVKPKPGDVKKIDGIVAGIMGLREATLFEPPSAASITWI